MIDKVEASASASAASPGSDADRELRSCAGKLRMALEIGRLGAWERNLTTDEVTGNATFKAYLGLPPEARLTYGELEKMFHPGDMERINQAIAFALRTQTDFNIEHRVIRPDGRIGRVLVRGGAVFEGGKPSRIIGVLQDITEREKAREEISLAQRRQEFLLTLNDHLRSLDDPDAIMEATAQSLGRYLKVDCAGYGEIDDERGVILVEREWSKGAIGNEGRAYRLYDFLPTLMEELRQGRSIFVEDIRNDPRASSPEVQAAYSTLNARTALAVPLLKNRRLTAILYVHSSEPRAWSGDDLSLAEDVAERTWTAVEKARAEIGLRETETRFRIIAESLPALVWILNPKTELTYTNERWVKFSGLPPEEALGHSWRRAIHPDDMAKMDEDLKDVVGNHTAYVTEARYRSHEGIYRWHLIKGEPVHSSSGEFKGWVGTSVDIDDLKQTEEALRKSEEQLRLALKAANMGDWKWDATTDITILSDRAAEIFGLPPGSTPKRTDLHAQAHPDDQHRVRAAVAKSIEEMAQYSVEYRIRRVDDETEVWIAAHGQTVFNQDGTLSGMSGVIQDITDRKQAEERQQLLIRELHHRVKNTLATVQAIVGSTARAASSIDEFYQGFVGRIVSLARTHNLLTEDLWQKASLGELIETELGPYGDEALGHVVIEGPPVELPSEAAVPVGMAIHELTTNAAKHGALSTLGGRVEVKWNIEEGEPPMLHFSWTEHGGPRVEAPEHQGFGSRLLQRVLTTQLQAQVNMDFREDGLCVTIVIPIPGEPASFIPDK